MRRKLFRNAPALLLMLGLSAAPASAETISIGFLFFDQFVLPDPNDQQAVGTIAFSIGNLTGPDALPPDFPAVDPLIFSDLELTLTGSDPLGTTVESFAIDPLGPGFLQLDFGPLFFLQFPDTTLFTSAMLTGVVNLGSFLLSDGRLFTPSDVSFSANLTPSNGGSLSPGDFAILEVSGEAQTVPEPSALVLLGSGVLMLLGYRRRRD